MKKLTYVLWLSCLAPVTLAQELKPTYSKVLADSLGADEYGMKQYILVILKTGTSKTTDKEKISNAFRKHLDNIGRLAREGKLVVAGPLGKNEKNYRGLFILNVETFEDARKLLKTDPAVRQNLLDFELYQWYGSAALPTYLKVHEQIEKKRP